MMKDELIARKQRELLISILLGESQISMKGNLKQLQVTLQEGKYEFLLDYIRHYKLPIEVKPLKKLNTYSIKGLVVSIFLETFITTVNRKNLVANLTEKDLTEEILVLWICLFGQYNNDDKSFIVKGSSSKYEMLNDIVQNAFFKMFNTKRIACIDSEFYLDSLENVFEYSVRAKLPTVQCMQLNEMIRGKTTIECQQSQLEKIKNIIRGERRNDYYYC